MSIVVVQGRYKNAFFAAVLIPYGPSQGDLTLPRGDNVVRNISLGVPFIVNTTQYTQAFIYTDGYITLGERINQRPFQFPLMSPPIIAPFISDHTTESTGNVYYRTISDRNHLAVLGNTIGLGQSGEVEEALVVTWEQVPLEFSRQVNSFQAVLATTGDRSYVIFLYGNESHNDGALIGINFGDGYSNITENNDYGIELRSNTQNYIGLFLYQVGGSGGGGPSTSSTTSDFVTMIPTMPDTPPSIESCDVERQFRSAGGVTTSFEVMNSRPNYQYNIRRVEVCHNSVYRPICSDFISTIEATVICREVVGYPFFSKFEVTWVV